MPHAVTLKLYNTASPANAIDKALGTAVTVQDVLLPPSFDYQSGDAVRFTVATTGSDWNYAELSGTPSNEAASRTWYYFIDRVECLGGTTGSTEGGYVAHLRLDPLMTYKREIKLEGLYVARNEVDYDIDIADVQVPQKYYRDRPIHPQTSSAIATPSNPAIVLQTVSKKGYSIYVMDAASFALLSEKLWDPSIWTQITTGIPYEAITRCFMLPYSYQAIADAAFASTAQVAGTVWIGNKEIAIESGDFSAYVFRPDDPLWTFYPTIDMGSTSMTLARDHQDWRSKDDVYQMYVPYCGIINLAGTELYHDNSTSDSVSVRVKYYLDIVTGDVTAEIFRQPALQPIHYLSGNMSVPIPLSSTNTGQRFISGITGALATVGGGVSAVMGAPFAGAAAMIGGALSIMTGQKETDQVSGIFGSMTSWRLPQEIIVYYIRSIYGTMDANFARTHGRPLYQTRIGSQLSGFTICENVHIQPENCPATVAAEIKRLLESGVYFDDGQ